MAILLYLEMITLQNKFLKVSKRILALLLRLPLTKINQ